MGLFGKIKNIFYDEEIVDVPEEPKSVEKPKIEEVKVEKKVEPIKRETPVINTTPTYSEREIFTRETTNTFKFPMLDEEEVKPARTRVNALESARMEKKKEETEKARTDKYKDLFKENTTTSSKPDRIFKPSPVISPVYGVLDKNYTREEIIERQENITRTTNPKDIIKIAIKTAAAINNAFVAFSIVFPPFLLTFVYFNLDNMYCMPNFINYFSLVRKAYILFYHFYGILLLNT